MLASDLYNNVEAGSPGVGSSLVTPSDVANLSESKVARRLYVTTAGTVHFTGVDGVEDTWTVPNNFYIDVAVQKVWATGTGAGAIRAIW